MGYARPSALMPFEEVVPEILVFPETPPRLPKLPKSRAPELPDCDPVAGNGNHHEQEGCAIHPEMAQRDGGGLTVLPVRVIVRSFDVTWPPLAGTTRLRLSLHLTTLDDDHTVVSRASLERAPLTSMVIQIAGASPASLHSDTHDMISTPNNHARHGCPPSFVVPQSPCSPGITAARGSAGRRPAWVDEHSGFLPESESFDLGSEKRLGQQAWPI